MNERMKELDGVRGIALLLVLALHMLVRAGYFTANPVLLKIVDLRDIGVIGVDIFFALSGFLITSILLRTKEHPHYFRNFYARRFLRIVPLYVLLLVLVLAFAPNLESAFKEKFWQILPFFLLFQQNWLYVIPGLTDTIYLSVTWSLAVEEQFYILWPLAVYYLRREVLLKWSIAYVIASIVIRVIAFSLVEGVDAAWLAVTFYYISFRGFEEILIGAILSLWLAGGNAEEQIARYAPLASVLALIGLSITLPSTNPVMNNLKYTFAALSTTGVIGIFLTRPPQHWVRRLFAGNVLVFFGKYSYSLYLFQLPILVFLLEWLWRSGARGWWVFFVYNGLGLLLTVACALLTWNLLEKHMLALKKYFEYDTAVERT